jgi:D-alanyl-D-alanine carboxypeptidase
MPTIPAPDAASPLVSDGSVAGLLQSRFDVLLQQRNIRHAVFAVESLDGSLRWAAAGGESPMKTDTPYCIASVTKLFIASALLRLVERGDVRLDDPLATYLPDALTGGLHRLGGVDYSPQLTVRHLVTHTSGLQDYLEAKPPGERSLFDRVFEEDLDWSLEETVSLVRRVKPHFPPQQFDGRRRRARYSDTNFQLLMAVIEAVSGKPVHEAFEELLYRRAGLRETWHPGFAPEGARTPATLWVGDVPLERPRALHAFRDLYSTAEENIRFMRALLRGELFDNPATLDVMASGWTRFGFKLVPTSPGWPIEYGHGIMRFRIPRLFSPRRPTPEVIGHTGVSGSWLFYCRELDLILAGTVDQVSAAATPFSFVPKVLRDLAAVAGRVPASLDGAGG